MGAAVAHDDHVLAWLNRNGAAIQALASVASVVTTLVLVWITTRYVALTQQLARAAREQLRIQRQFAASEVAQLITLVDVFLGTIARLPRDPRERRRLEEIAPWKRGDVMALATLAASVVGAEAPVRQCVQSLNWLREKLEQTREAGDGARDVALTASGWQRELDLASESLKRVRAAAEDAQAAPSGDAIEAS